LFTAILAFGIAHCTGGNGLPDRSWKSLTLIRPR
jgi:hypothetical protein